MNKTLGIGVTAIVVIAAGVGMYSSSSPKNEAALMEKDQMEKAAMEQEQMKQDATMQNDSMMQQKDSMMQQKDSMMHQDNKEMMDTGTKTMMKDEQAMMSSGSYEAYAPAKIAMASAQHDVVLFFRASWCPTCKAVDTDITSHLKSIPASLTILDVDYDNSTDLKKKYGVTYQHTFVQVDAQGNLIKKWSGSPTLSALISEVK